MKKLWIVVLVAAFAVALYPAIASLFADGDSSADDEATVVFLCSETHQVIAGPPQPTPAVNPQTGRRTLVRALYCGQCGKWHAVPPSDKFGGNPMSVRCPKHKIPMSPTGPVDEVVKAEKSKN